LLIYLQDWFGITYTRMHTHTHTQISFVDSKDLKGVVQGLSSEDSEAGKFVPIAAIECRGLEPVGYTPEVRVLSEVPGRDRYLLQRGSMKFAWKPLVFCFFG